MRLHKAASFFDDSVLYDAYANTLIGNGQLDPTDIFKLDGASVRRRVISVNPDVILPTRRAVRLGADVYLIGEPSTDEWNGTPIRTKYVLHQTPGMATVKTLVEALADAAGTTMYASREWNKDVADLKTSSDYFNDYHIFVANTEVATQGSLIFIDGQWHYCHAVHPSLSGFTDLVSHEIIGTVFETVLVTGTTYDPVADSYSGSDTSVKILRMRWQERFEYLTLAQEEYVRGDETVVILKASLPNLKPSDTLALSDGAWRVLAVHDDGATLTAHVRRN